MDKELKDKLIELKILLDIVFQKMDDIKNLESERYIEVNYTDTDRQTGSLSLTSIFYSHFLCPIYVKDLNIRLHY